MNLQAGTFARVIIPSPLKQPLTYRVPVELEDFVCAGMRVLIPLGKRRVSGVVLERTAEMPAAVRIRDIIAVLDPDPILDQVLLKLSLWISQYYVTSLGEVLATILPPHARIEIQEIVVARTNEEKFGNPMEHAILTTVRRNKGGITLKSLSRKMGGVNFSKALAQLKADGLIDIRERIPGERRRMRARSNTDTANVPEPNRFPLSIEQHAAVSAVEARLQTGGFATFLLHGVTGSGKTEVYLRAMERVHKAGRQSLILTPEISLTPQLLDRLNARFPGKVGVLHSGLTAAERWTQWWQILHGRIDVVVGARSAVFAPVPQVGLIVVDEEHDSSYKQDDGLRYNGRDVAVVRGKLSNCPVILGSATPSLESYENCRQGRYRLLEISQRVQQRPLPRVEIVDLRNRHEESQTPVQDEADFPPPGKSAGQKLIAEQLAEAVKRNFVDNRQTLIFLNRRGFANFLQCKLCGYVWRCPHCSVTLTLHLKRKLARCHHCDFSRPASGLCPGCGNDSLAGVGAGTEQIERVLISLLPQARIARMDRDTTTRRGAQEDMIRRWQRGELDILIGTQMITKGHDVAGVTLVAALLADMSLNLPDFRSAERTFQLLSQVAGRAGRGDEPGRVVIQTYDPEHYAIRPLVEHDYKMFFAAEAEFRRALGYPPFGKLINLRLDGPDCGIVESKARELAGMLRNDQRRHSADREPIEILGPAPAPIEKVRNRYRWQVLLKGKQIGALLDLAVTAREAFRRVHRVRLRIDVDPYNML